MPKTIENVVVLITGISGIGKRTVGEALCALDPSFKSVTPDDWMTPILRLLGNDASTMDLLTPDGWHAVNKVRDAVFDTIAHICPQQDNFVISDEMRQGDVWHRKNYERVEQLAQEKGAVLIPIRLICDLPILLTRLVNEERKKYIFKPLDAESIKQRFLTTETIKTGSKFEFTLDTTKLSPQESARTILEHVHNVL